MDGRTDLCRSRARTRARACGARRRTARGARQPVARRPPRRDLGGVARRGADWAFPRRRRLRRREGEGARAVGTSAADDDADFDISVFQFTLGIPGIPDEQIPRILGSVTCALLALNHVASDVVDGAQARSELVAAILGATCIALPTLNRMINFNNSSILSQAERTVPDTREVFFLADGEAEATLRELAWVSFALLKNTNSSFVLFAKDGRLMLARGSFKVPGLPQGIPVTENYPVDTVLEKSFEMTGGFEALNRLAGGGGGGGERPAASEAAVLETKGAIEGAMLYRDLCFLAKGIETVVACASGGGGVLVVGANKAKAFSKGQQTWIASAARKLATLPT